jgi:protein SCO1
MKPISRRALWTGAGRTAPADTPQFAPPLSGREILRQRSFPNLPLITHHGRHVRFYDDLLKDKIVVINMMYAVCDGICPVITANLVKAQQLLKAGGAHDIFFYSITLKPEEDTPEKLRAYADMHGVRGNWQFLTGAPADIERLRHTLGYADLNPKVDKDTTRHSGIVRYGNEPLSQWGACQGSATPSWIAEEISFVVPARRA